VHKSPLPSLKKNREFRAVFAKGRHAVCPLFSVHVLENGFGANRLGIQAGKKVGGAVVRNRVRRLVKESYRLMAGELNISFDIVVAVRPSAGEFVYVSGFKGVDEHLRKLCQKIGILK